MVVKESLIPWGRGEFRVPILLSERIESADELLRLTQNGRFDYLHIAATATETSQLGFFANTNSHVLLKEGIKTEIGEYDKDSWWYGQFDLNSDGKLSILEFSNTASAVLRRKNVVGHAEALLSRIDKSLLTDAVPIKIGRNFPYIYYPATRVYELEEGL